MKHPIVINLNKDYGYTKIKVKQVDNSMDSFEDIANKLILFLYTGIPGGSVDILTEKLKLDRLQLDRLGSLLENGSLE